MFFLRKIKLYLTINTILSLFLALSRLMTHNILQCIKKKKKWEKFKRNDLALCQRSFDFYAMVPLLSPR